MERYLKASFYLKEIFLISFVGLVILLFDIRKIFLMYKNLTKKLSSKCQVSIELDQKLPVYNIFLPC